MAKASELLREQAERCAKLANLASDQSLGRNLRALAEDYWARADRLERREQKKAALLPMTLLPIQQQQQIQPTKEQDKE